MSEVVLSDRLLSQYSQYSQYSQASQYSQSPFGDFGVCFYKMIFFPNESYMSYESHR